jgi:HK97 family phage prohead protease
MRDTTGTRVRMNRTTARDFQEVNRSFARTKTITAEIKRSPSDGSGVFVALVSTFDLEPDSQGDVIGRHAFDRTVNEARVKHPDALFPVWWQHSYSDPSAAIGLITRAVIDDAGLVVEGRLNIDTNEKALGVYEGLLEGTIREWSISYGIVAEHRENINGKDVNVLDELELLEISAVMRGANANTRTLSVKSDTEAAKALREFLKVHERTGGRMDPDTLERISATFIENYSPVVSVPHVVDPDVQKYKATLDAIAGSPAASQSELVPGDRAALDAAAGACLDAAAVADSSCDRFAVNDLPRMVALRRCATQLREIALRLVSTGGANVNRRRAATNAAQNAEAMRLVSEVLEARGEFDVARDIRAAADKVTAAADPLAGHQLAPPKSGDRGTEHLDGDDLVDQFIEQERLRKQTEKAEADERAALAAMVRDMPTPMSEPDIDARDADQHARDLEKIAQRAAERKFELQRDLAEQAALREGGFTGTHYYRGEQ